MEMMSMQSRNAGTYNGIDISSWEGNVNFIREGNNKMFFFIGDNCFCQMLWMEEVERSGIRL